MKAAIDYLDEAKTKSGSDRQTGIRTGLSPQYISNVRRGVHGLNNNACRALGELLGISPLEIIAAAEAERDKKNRGKWARYVAAAFVAVMIAPVLCILCQTMSNVSLRPAKP